MARGDRHTVHRRHCRRRGTLQRRPGRQTRQAVDGPHFNVVVVGVLLGVVVQRNRAVGQAGVGAAVEQLAIDADAELIT
jgi:hypothetical protein